MRGSDPTLYFRLDGKLAVPVKDFAAWSQWLASVKGLPHVAETTIGPIWVSTIFLGIDHSYGNGALPILFETMVFRGDECGERDRCSSWVEAEEMHERHVKKVRAEIAQKNRVA